MIPNQPENQWSSDNLHAYINSQADKCAAEWGVDRDRLRDRFIQDWLDLAWPAGNA